MPTKEDPKNLKDLTTRLTLYLLFSLEEIKQHNFSYDHTSEKFIQTANNPLKEANLTEICKTCGNQKIPCTKCTTGANNKPEHCCFGTNHKCCRCGKTYQDLMIPIDAL